MAVMDERRQRVRALFDAVADGYDQVGVDFFRPIAEGLVRELDPRPGEHALDLGCGRGAALLPLAHAVGPTGSVLGGDLSPRMVEHAAALAAEEGLTGVEVRIVDAQQPDPAITGRHADVLCSSLVLFFLPDPAAAVRRWRELVRPGGRVGVSTFGPGDPTWQRIDALFRPHLPPELLDARTSGAAGPFESDAGVEGLFTDAGWVDVRTVVESVPVRFDDADHWYRFSMSTGQRGFWSMVPEDRRAGLRADATAIIDEAAGPDGSVTFHQGVRYTLARHR